MIGYTYPPQSPSCSPHLVNNHNNNPHTPLTPYTGSSYSGNSLPGGESNVFFPQNIVPIHHVYPQQPHTPLSHPAYNSINQHQQGSPLYFQYHPQQPPYHQQPYPSQAAHLEELHRRYHHTSNTTSNITSQSPTTHNPLPRKTASRRWDLRKVLYKDLF